MVYLGYARLYRFKFLNGIDFSHLTKPSWVLLPVGIGFAIPILTASPILGLRSS